MLRVGSRKKMKEVGVKVFSWQGVNFLNRGLSHNGNGLFIAKVQHYMYSAKDLSVFYDNIIMSTHTRARKNMGEVA